MSSEYRFIPRTYVLGIINGATFYGAMRLIDPSTVGALFVMHLTGSKAMVGLVYSLMLLGWGWPQLLISNVVEPRPRKLAFYRLSAALRITVFGLVLLAVWGIGDRNHVLLFVAFAALMFSFSSLSGVGIIPFMDIVSKSVPPNRRGRFFSYRQLYGGLIGIAVGFYVKFILSPDVGLAFPTNFLVIFGTAYVFVVLSTGSFCFVTEPAGVVSARRMGFWQRLRRGVRIFRQDRNYRRLYWVRTALAFGAMAVPLYAVHAVENLGASEDQIGVFILVGSITAAVSTFVWRHIGDVYGNRLLMLSSGCLSLVAPAVALCSRHVPTIEAPLVGMDLRLLLYLMVFATAFPAMYGSDIGITNYLLEIASETRRPTYVGFMYTISTPLALIPWLAGQGADVTCPEVVFGLSLAFSVAAVWLVMRIDEPRQSRQLAGRYSRWESSLRGDGAWSGRPPAGDGPAPRG